MIRATVNLGQRTTKITFFSTIKSSLKVQKNNSGKMSHENFFLEFR